MPKRQCNGANFFVQRTIVKVPYNANHRPLPISHPINPLKRFANRIIPTEPSHRRLINNKSFRRICGKCNRIKFATFYQFDLKHIEIIFIDLQKRHAPVRVLVSLCPNGSGNTPAPSNPPAIRRHLKHIRMGAKSLFHRGITGGELLSRV